MNQLRIGFGISSLTRRDAQINLEFQALSKFPKNEETWNSKSDLCKDLTLFLCMILGVICELNGVNL